MANPSSPLTPNQQLEQWADLTGGWPKVTLFWVQLETSDHLYPVVVVYRCPSEEKDYHSYSMGNYSVAAGTDEDPANIDTMISVALAKWEELTLNGTI